MKVQVKFEAVQTNGFAKTVVVEVPDGMTESDLDDEILDAVRDFGGEEGWERSYNDRDDFKFVAEPAIARVEADEASVLKLVLKNGAVFIQAGSSAELLPIRRGTTILFDQSFSQLAEGKTDRKKQRVLIHWVTSGESTGGWVHTHGMCAHGLPELEIRNVQGFLGEQAAKLLRHVSDYMLGSGNEVLLGQTMATSDRTRFRFIKDCPIPGEEDHYEVERWRLVEVSVHCDECGATQCESN
jgi:hypothetical protein